MKINQPVKFVTIIKAIGNKIGILTIKVPLFKRGMSMWKHKDKMKTTKTCVLLVTSMK